MVLSSAAHAQKTVVVDAGAGMKQEIVYDASGQVVETRTIGADGKLQVRNVYAYPPGYYTGGIQTTTNYWPDGKSVQLLSTEDFDANGNFTEETISEYDQSGKHTRGHRLLHEPMTGLYRCWDWDVVAQRYKSIECPAGEESGGHESPKPLSLEQARKQLATAEQAARTQEKSARMLSKAPSSPSTQAVASEVGLVLPAQLTSGERVSGRVVEDPSQYEGIPDLTVVRFALPSAAQERPPLTDWSVEAPGAQPQAASGPVTFTIPDHAKQFDITLRTGGDTARSVTHTITAKAKAATHPKSAITYKSAVLCVKDDVCAVSGPFTGDSRQNFAAVGETPAPILAETQEALYLAVPDNALNGPQYLLVTQTPKLLAFPISVAQVSVRADTWEVKKDGKSMVFFTVAGPGDLSDAQWSAGIFPPSNLERARALIPGFKLPRKEKEEHESREAQEKKREAQEKKKEKDDKDSGQAAHEGMVLVVARNTAPKIASFHGSPNGTYVFDLTPDSFAMGDFVYKFVAEGSREGTYGVKGTIIPFLAPVAPQEFPLEKSPAQAGSGR